MEEDRHMQTVLMMVCETQSNNLKTNRNRGKFNKVVPVTFPMPVIIFLTMSKLRNGELTLDHSTGGIQCISVVKA